MTTTNDCVFCKIVAGELPSKKVWENDDFMAFHDIHPTAPIDVLVIPKKHVEKRVLAEKPDNEFHGNLMNAVYATIKELELETKGFDIVIYGGGRQIIEHEHYHIRG